MKKSKAIIAVNLALVISLFASMLAACSGSKDTAAVTESAASDMSGISKNTTDGYPDSIPRNLDLGGTTVTFIARSDDEGANDVSVGEQNGEVFNDAVWRRNRTVEDRLNVKINAVKIAGDYNSRDAFIKTVSDSILAGDLAYDVIAGYQYIMPTFVTEKLLADITDLPYIDLKAPWWVQDIVDKTTINGALYLLPGDLSVSMFRNMVAVFYDKKLAENYKLGDLYETIRNGGWTLDSMYNTTKGVYSDLNGDGKRGTEDQFGLVLINGNFLMQFTAGCGLSFVVPTSDGKLKITVNSEKTVNFIDKLDSILYGGSDNVGEAEKALAGGSVVNSTAMFREDRILYYPCTFYFAGLYLRDMTGDYGVLPLPKYDDKQEKYYTSATDGSTVYAVPVNCGKPDAVGAVLEALSAASSEVKSVYFETVLKTKYARDKDTAEMIDIITSGITYDFGILYSISFNGGFSIKSYFSAGAKQGFASWYASYEQKNEAALNNLLNIFYS